MKIVAFNGSPNGREGMTQAMVHEFLQGARDAGAETETIFLKNQKILHCRACLTCWVKTPGTCVLQDDMSRLRSAYLAADAAVFATPLYIDNVTGMMKIFMDRLFMTMEDPHWERDEHGECRHVRRPERLPKLVVISSCGAPEQSHFQVLRLLFRRIARQLNFELAAEIYRGGGSLLFRKEARMDEFAQPFKQLLRQAGQEFARNSTLSGKIRERLEQPFMPGDDYVEKYTQTGNRMFDGWITMLRARDRRPAAGWGDKGTSTFRTTYS